jgi:hypothetical protein
VLKLELATSNITLTSRDGRYEITYPQNYEGWAQIAEYDGAGPRRELKRTSVPMELLNMFFDKLNFEAPDFVK